jgi:hypothetical protein
VPNVPTEQVVFAVTGPSSTGFKCTVSSPMITSWLVGVRQVGEAHKRQCW